MNPTIKIRSFARSDEFNQMYADTYGDGDVSHITGGSKMLPPAKGHMNEIRSDLIEWTEQLETDKIYISPAAAIARFAGAKHAAGVGRSAIEARVKVAQFYADVIRRATGWDGTDTEAPTMAYFIAVAEVRAAAKDYRRARSAASTLASDPESASVRHEIDALERSKERAKEKFYNAVAEAVGLATAAAGDYGWVEDLVLAQHPSIE